MYFYSKYLTLPAIAGFIGLALLTIPNSQNVAAQQQPQRTAVRAAIVLREGSKVTLNRGSQDGLRKGDKLTVYHNIDGKYVPSGKLVVTRVAGTTAEAKVTEQTGTVGPEDVTLSEVEAPTSAPAEPTRKAPAEPSRKTPAETSPTVPIPTRTVSSEPVRKPDSPLPLLPQFSTDKAGGASFTFEYTNDTEKVVDASLFRLSARLICDDQDYRTNPTTLTGNYNVLPGKSRSFSFNLTDFTLTNDKDAWPLKSGRHTALIKFGGKQYGPLTFVWNSDSPAK